MNRVFFISFLPIFKIFFKLLKSHSIKNNSKLKIQKHFTFKVILHIITKISISQLLRVQVSEL